MPVNVFVAEGQNLVRQGLKAILEEQCDVTVVGEAKNGFECLSEVNKLNPNVLILDVNMSGMDGIKTLQIMKEQGFNVRILMIASEFNNEQLMKAVDSGCDGFLLKDAEVSVLRQAIYTIYDGGKFIQSDLKEQLTDTMDDRANLADKLNELTKREVDVLKLLAEGLFNKEIAVKLDISERTVKNHVSNIFKKIQVNDRTQAAVFAIKNNLISL